MAATESRTITATIARIHGRGFLTREQPDRWLNLSKLAGPGLAIPPVGTQVSVQLDSAGYVRGLTALAGRDRPDLVTQEPLSLDDLGHRALAPAEAAIVRSNLL